MQLDVSFDVDVPEEVLAQLGPDDGSPEWEERAHHLAIAWVEEDPIAALDYRAGLPSIKVW